jgi:hypothetical protein
VSVVVHIEAIKAIIPYFPLPEYMIMFKDTNLIFIEDLFTPVNDISAMKWNKQIESQRRFKFVGGGEGIRTWTKGKIKQFLSVEIFVFKCTFHCAFQEKERGNGKKSAQEAMPL